MTHSSGIVLDRRETPRGELVLRRVGTAYEIISNGVFLMDSRSGESERLLVSAALARVRRPCRVLIGGLGMGFSVQQALQDDGVDAVAVVEIEQAVIDWHHGFLPGSPLADQRVRVHRADLLDFLREGTEPYDVICLDIDNGPQWTVVPENTELYGDSGLDLLRGRLADGGALGVWSAAADEPFAERLRARFGRVEALRVPVPRGEPDVVYIGSAA